MTNFTYYYNGAMSSVENTEGYQFVVHGLLILIGIACLVLMFLWYDSREEAEDGNKIMNHLKFSQKLKNLCCLPESCQSSIAKCFIELGIIGSTYLEVLQEDEAIRETRTLEKLMEARKIEKEKKKRSRKSSRHRKSSDHNMEYLSDDGDSVHSGHGLL